jgi:hypothetical protein
MFSALLVMSHDGPFKTQYIVRGVSEIAKDSLAHSRGTEAFHSAFISGGMTARRSGCCLRSIGTDRILNEASVPDRVKISRTLPARPDGVTPFIIEERDVQWLMYIADPMS